MARKPGFYRKDGWFVTSAGGRQHHKLCRVAEGEQLARSRLLELVGDQEIRFSRTKLYLVWRGLFYRKYRYPTPVCDEWNDFLKFRSWALDNGYREGLSIDRIDNSAGYSPQNCRWVTQKTQMNNTSVNVRITIREETKTVTEWSEDPRCRVSKNMLIKRVRQIRRFLGLDKHLTANMAILEPFSQSRLSEPR